MKLDFEDTIVALSTAKGSAAIAVIRLSGDKAIEIVNKFMYSKKLNKIEISKMLPKTNIFSLLLEDKKVVDEVLINVFKSPKSYTGQDCVEVSCHGSPYIQQKLLKLFLNAGARMAQPGEFTLRAFLNRKFDLSQAEAVSDLIASSSSSSHQLAMIQMRGGYSQQIKTLRHELINFASLIELELDFSEEDVEFADRTQLNQLIDQLFKLITKLLHSFEIGNVLKNGVPVAIVGKPNAGKSTLLNALLDDDRAIVSEIPGTTRDTIEDEVNLNGVVFRFIDTAGLRATKDSIETIGIAKTYETIKKAAVVIYLFDVNELSVAELEHEISQLKKYSTIAKIIPVGNKIDSTHAEQILQAYTRFNNLVFISAKKLQNIDDLKTKLLQICELENLDSLGTIVTNARHAHALQLSLNHLKVVQEALNLNLSGEFLAQDIRLATQELGQITGEVHSEDLLSNIFSHFCIGK